MKMQESADELQRMNEKVSAVKEDIKTKSRQLEALRSQRAELEKIRSSKVDEVEDPRYAGLYDWFALFFVPVVEDEGSSLDQVHCRDLSPPVHLGPGNFPRGVRKRATVGI